MASPLTCIIIGENTLPLQCAGTLERKGHNVVGVIAADPLLIEWAGHRKIACVSPDTDLEAFAAGLEFDYLFSIVNFKILPPALVRLARKGAINFHDSPLPRYAGYHATSWALMHQEPEHGVSWHLIREQIDAGQIVKQKSVAVSDTETAFTLNAKCFEAGISSFEEMIDELAAGTNKPIDQDPQSRTYFAKFKRPPAGGVVDWNDPADKIDALVRSLDFGPHANPLGSPKILLDNGYAVITKTAVIPGDTAEASGTILSISPDGVSVSTGKGTLLLKEVRSPDTSWRPGTILPRLTQEQAATLTTLSVSMARHEEFWVKRLADIRPLTLDAACPSSSDAVAYAALPVGASESTRETLALAYTAFLARLRNDSNFDIGFRAIVDADLFAQTVPLRVTIDPDSSFTVGRPILEEELKTVIDRQSYARDAVYRYPELKSVGARPLELTIDFIDQPENYQPADGTLLALAIPEDPTRAAFLYDTRRLRSHGVLELQRQFATFLSDLASNPTKPVADLALLSSEQLQQLLIDWNRTRINFLSHACIHQLFDEQVQRTPNAIAASFENKHLTYRELDERANRLANHLQALGVEPRTLVGICLERSLDMLVSMMAVLKAGCAYVPLDPQYPAERLAFMVEDARLAAILTTEDLTKRLPATTAIAVCVDSDRAKIAAREAVAPRTDLQPHDLAYVIYTSGSTGKPKGVMVTHRNVVNFFTGMDQEIGRDPGIWLAVTSISFDISVLELLWTLTRGFKVVIAGEHTKSTAPVSKPLDFSLFYFGSQVGDDVRDRYRMLLEGAKFADEHDFTAVWTPERHFHAFGGLFPNPSVTSAAIAAITKRVQIRAGSVVLPLHNPIRVAEEWSVVDNISNGRVGISFASGWHERDFVFAPGNYANAKDVMFRDIDVVRKLWRGESTTAIGGKGQEVAISIMPPPVQRELPVWVTAAGTPETFRMAGEKGANLLTHLLGQNIETLTEKIRIYREAWKAAGHAGAGHVTLMLHTFVGATLDEARETVRKPFSEYLKTSVDLIKDSPWSFPAAKRPDGVEPQKLQLKDLAPEDLQALLDHAFNRYFKTSGLFGSPADCVEMANTLRGLGVDEIACLIDFGVETDTALAALTRLDEVRRLVNRAAESVDNSIPALIHHHGVTHMQCTPSMARMLMMTGESQNALRSVSKLMIGGEALPTDLAEAVLNLPVPSLLNMYGPTETTIWSTTHKIAKGDTKTPIGRPIANTQLYVLDTRFRPVPAGAAGELFIGGEGVVRGYLNREELTAERFVDWSFNSGPSQRLYRTGDLVRYRPDGVLEFLGRIDHQVKIRGFRIELGEIETVLNRHPAIAESVVVAREQALDKVLVAYIVSKNGDIPTAAMRSHLQSSLPDHMVPSAFVRLKALPLTPNGKIDRKALPDPDRSQRDTGKPYAAPQNDLESQLTEIWQKALNLEKVGVDDNFFDLGAHSILMVQVNVKLRETLKQEISLISMFRFPTVRSLAAHLSQPSEPSSTVGQGADRARLRRDALAKRMELRDRTRAAGNL